jgi:hypothetical protein
MFCHHVVSVAHHKERNAGQHGMCRCMDTFLTSDNIWKDRERKERERESEGGTKKKKRFGKKTAFLAYAAFVVALS